MPWLRLNNFEYAGYTADINAHLLPPNALSSLVNAHTKDGSVERYNGYVNAYTPADTPLWLLSGGFVNPQILSAGESSILNVSAGSDVTPSGGLASVEAGAWTGGVMHGLFVLNNGIDPPLYWQESASLVQEMPNWPAGVYCGVVRPFKNYLFAGNIYEAVALPTVIQWSTQTNPGEVPASWNYADPTNDSGRFTLSDTSGKVVDFLAANDSLFCYKEDAVYEITYVGGVFIFKFAPRFTQFGLFAPNCSVNHRGLSYALGHDDIVVHGSAEMKSIVSSTLRRRIFNGVSAGNLKKSFVSFDPLNQELMFCVPWNSDNPDYAFTYRPDTQKWGERELPQCSHLITGKVVLGGVGGAWSTACEFYNGTLTHNAAAIYGASCSKIVDAQTIIAKVASPGISILNQTYTHDGSLTNVKMERIAVDFGTDKSPNERIKFVDRVRPHIISANGETFLVSVGTQMNLADPITWKTAVFVKGFNRDVAFRVNGRYISWRIEYIGAEDFKLESLDIEVRLGAMW